MNTLKDAEYSSCRSSPPVRELPPPLAAPPRGTSLGTDSARGWTEPGPRSIALRSRPIASSLYIRLLLHDVCVSSAVPCAVLCSRLACRAQLVLGHRRATFFELLLERVHAVAETIELRGELGMERLQVLDAFEGELIGQHENTGRGGR